MLFTIRVVYDTSHFDYMRGTYKDEIWAHIACILQLKDGVYRLLLYENCKYNLEIRFSVSSESDSECPLMYNQGTL